MNQFELWVEGYAATGEHGTARFLGRWSGETFDEAVKKWNATKNIRSEYGDLRWSDNDHMWSVWGCRIFDNEADARRSFG